MSSGDRLGPWDDTLLIKAFDTAVRDHQRMHGVSTDGKDETCRDEITVDGQEVAAGDLNSFLMEEASRGHPDSDTADQTTAMRDFRGSEPEEPAGTHVGTGVGFVAENTETSQPGPTPPDTRFQQQAENSGEDAALHEQYWRHYGHPFSGSYWPLPYPSTSSQPQPGGRDYHLGPAGGAAQPLPRGHCHCCTQSQGNQSQAPQPQHPGSYAANDYIHYASTPGANVQYPMPWTYARQSGYPHPNSISAPVAAQPQSHLHIAPPAAPTVHSLDGQDLQAMLHAWYQAGFVAGRVEGKSSR